MYPQVPPDQEGWYAALDLLRRIIQLHYAVNQEDAPAFLRQNAAMHWHSYEEQYRAMVAWYRREHTSLCSEETCIDEATFSTPDHRRRLCPYHAAQEGLNPDYIHSALEGESP